MNESNKRSNTMGERKNLDLLALSNIFQGRRNDFQSEGDWSSMKKVGGGGSGLSALSVLTPLYLNFITNKRSFFCTSTKHCATVLQTAFQFQNSLNLTCCKNITWSVHQYQIPVTGSENHNPIQGYSLSSYGLNI